MFEFVHHHTPASYLAAPTHIISDRLISGKAGLCLGVFTLVAQQVHVNS